MSEIGPMEIMQRAQSFMENRILFSAAELDLFTILGKDSLTAPEAAAAVGGADLRALTMLLDAVAAIGLLIKEDSRYRCPAPVARLMSKDSPETVLPMVLHMASLWTRWSDLTGVVRGGSDREIPAARRDSELRSFIGAMHAIGTPLARQVVAAVQAGASRALIDIGGGSGTYTVAFLKAVPGMRATIFDLPDVIEMARERLAEEGLLDRVSLVPGSFHDQELPTGHDLALLSAIVHSNSPEENWELYGKAFRCLIPGGRILIRDHVMEPDRIRPKEGALFAINMLVGTSGGGTYTFEEIASGLSRAGFGRIRLLRRGDHMDAVVEAYRPSGP